MINIVIVDDQNLVMEGICSLLELNSEFNVVAKIDDSTRVVETLHQCNPNVLLLDIRMPKMDGLEVLRAMQYEGIDTPTLMLTTFDEHKLVLNSLSLGAKGYLRKDVSLEELTEAIYTLSAKGSWIQPAVSCQLKSNSECYSQQVQLLESLTAGETEVLRLIAAGFSNHEIADALHKSSGRIRNIVTAILDKLAVRDRTQAALKGLELGLISKN